MVHVVLAWLGRTPGLGWGEDDAAFLLLAQDLQAFRFRELQDILAPVQARFPPVFPAMLAVVGKVFGNNLDALLAFMAVCSAVSVVLLYDGARRAFGDELAALATTLYAINPSAVGDAGSLMSEAPFKLFICLALWAAIRESEGTRFAVIAAISTVLAALTRSAGVVLIPALGLHWLLRRRYRWVVGLAFASLPVVAWQVFSFLAPDADDRRLYVADLTGGESVGTVVRNRLSYLFPRIWSYLTDHVPWVVAIPTVRGTVVDNAMWVAANVVFGLGGVYALLRRWALSGLFLLAYIALLMVWPYAFERLVRPILPIILLAIIVGASVVVGRFSSRYARWTTFALAGLLAVGAIRVLSHDLQLRLACDRRVPAESPQCWPEPEREFLQLAHWIRDSTPDDALFLVSKERAFYVHSGRKSINQDRALREDSTTIGDYLRSRGVDYTVVTPIGIFGQLHGRLIASACRDFDIVKQVSPRALLLRLLPERAPSDSTATCRIVRELAHTQFVRR